MILPLPGGGCKFSITISDTSGGERVEGVRDCRVGEGWGESRAYEFFGSGFKGGRRGRKQLR